MTDYRDVVRSADLKFLCESSGFGATRVSWLFALVWTWSLILREERRDACGCMSVFWGNMLPPSSRFSIGMQPEDEKVA